MSSLLKFIESEFSWKLELCTKGVSAPAVFKRVWFFWVFGPVDAITCSGFLAVTWSCSCWNPMMSRGETALEWHMLCWHWIQGQICWIPGWQSVKTWGFMLGLLHILMRIWDPFCFKNPLHSQCSKMQKAPEKKCLSADLKTFYPKYSVFLFCFPVCFHSELWQRKQDKDKWQQSKGGFFTSRSTNIIAQIHIYTENHEPVKPNK